MGVNCKFNDQGTWCTNKNIKRSLFGFLGPRCCVDYPMHNKCKWKEHLTRPSPPLPQGRPRMKKEDKEKLIAASLESKEIKSVYDTYIIKEIPFETWVRSVTDRILGEDSR